MGVGDVVVKSSRSLSHLMSSCIGLTASWPESFVRAKTSLSETYNISNK